MNNDEKIEILKIWQEVSKKYIDVSSAYIDLTYCSEEAPHIKTADNILDEYTKLVAEITGIPFDDLLCWVFDLKCGEVEAYEVRVDGKWHIAETVEGLFSVWVLINKD